MQTKPTSLIKRIAPKPDSRKTRRTRFSTWRWWSYYGEFKEPTWGFESLCSGFLIYCYCGEVDGIDNDSWLISPCRCCVFLMLGLIAEGFNNKYSLIQCLCSLPLFRSFLAWICLGRGSENFKSGNNIKNCTLRALVVVSFTG